jgi:hypothetical protein
MSDQEIIAVMSTPFDPVVLQFSPGHTPGRIDIQSPTASGPDADAVIQAICRVTATPPMALIFEPVAGEEAWRSWVLNLSGKRVCRITWSLDHAIGTGAFVLAARLLARDGWRPTSDPISQGQAA